MGLMGCQNEAAPKDAMAKVNGRYIYRPQVEARYRMEVGTGTPGNAVDNGDALRLQVLLQLIQEEVLQQEAERMHVAATPEEVGEQFDDLRADFSKEEFDAQLQQLKTIGLGLDDLKRQIRQERSQEKLYNMVINSKIRVTDADVAHYYAMHKDAFNQTEPGYHLAEIVVKPDNRGKATWLLSQLEQGADFGRLAASFSDDEQSKKNQGDMGVVLESQLEAATGDAEAIKRLKAGGFTGVLAHSATDALTHEAKSEKPDAYVIYRLIERSPAGQRDLSDPQVQQSILVELRQERAQVLGNAYWEMLRTRAKVENYFAKSLVERAQH